LEVKWKEREAHHSPVSGGAVKNGGTILPFPHYVFII
jgi:hypothetical protein